MTNDNNSSKAQEELALVIQHIIARTGRIANARSALQPLSSKRTAKKAPIVFRVA